MATVTWQPVNGGELFNQPETGGSVSFTISGEAEVVDPVTGEPGTEPVTDYGYSLSPSDPAGILSITADSQGVTLEASSLVGLFPLQYIDYLLDGELQRVSAWDDLPEAAEDIIAFRPSDSQAKTFTLTVTGEVDGESVSEDFTFTITQDWTAGKERLQEEIDARR